MYVNGKFIARGTKSPNTVPPGTGQAFLSEGASFYNGHISEPEIIKEALPEAGIRQLAQKRVAEKSAPRVVEPAANGKPGLLFWENGRYTLQDSAARATPLQITGVRPPVALAGPWQVSFPLERGAPAQVTLPELKSLHLHAQDGIKHVSGTATYRKFFNWAARPQPNQEERVFLDLGRVEVISEVRLNGKDLGIFWKRPFLVDITGAVKAGTNNLEVLVTNLWPNRLIGDEKVPDTDKFTAGAGASGFASLSNGAIEQLPEWYQQGKPKPDIGRVTFTGR